MLLSRDVVNAGSVFLGNWSCESAGDYASGTNHTLPTSGYAKAYSGVSLDSFVKKITFQQLSEEGIRHIGNAVEIMAATEQLDAHKNAVTLRLGAATARHLDSGAGDLLAEDHTTAIQNNRDTINPETDTEAAQPNEEL